MNSSGIWSMRKERFYIEGQKCEHRSAYPPAVVEPGQVLKAPGLARVGNLLF